MRILHIQKSTGIGGSERHLLNLLPGLVHAGVEVRFCVAAAGNAVALTDQLDQQQIPNSTVSAGPDLNPLLVRSLRQQIREFRPDLVHTHLIHADLHGQLAARLERVPAVSSVHGAAAFYRKRPYRLAGRLGGGSARLTIAISNYVGDFLEELRLRPPGTIRVIPYGIDPGGWLADERERVAARARFDLADDQVAIGVASRLIAHKGHEMLIEAFRRAGAANPRLRLLIAGTGPLDAELQRRAAALGEGVRFLGFVSEIRAFMHSCDLLVFPSQPQIGEGFGLAALEAMAAARPVIATRACSLPEVVDEPNTGLLVDPASVGELADALLKLGGDAEIRARMGQAGRRRALESFSLEAMVERTHALYTEALST